MAGSNRQRKSSFSFFFVFNLFKSKKAKGGQCDPCDAWRKVWPSDEDKGRWGVAEPNINKKADDFIQKTKLKISDHQLGPAAGTA